MLTKHDRIAYDNQSAEWQQGYDDFYESDADDYDDIANEPSFRPDGHWFTTDDQRRDYSRGWDHANLEASYGPYMGAKGGLKD